MEWNGTEQERKGKEAPCERARNGAGGQGLRASMLAQVKSIWSMKLTLPKRRLEREAPSRERGETSSAALGPRKFREPHPPLHIVSLTFYAPPAAVLRAALLSARLGTAWRAAPPRPIKGGTGIGAGCKLTAPRRARSEPENQEQCVFSFARARLRAACAVLARSQSQVLAACISQLRSALAGWLAEFARRGSRAQATHRQPVDLRARCSSLRWATRGNATSSRRPDAN